MTDWIKPGPESIEAGQCPDGLVMHIYSVPDGELLRVSKIDTDTVEQAAIDDGDAVAERPGPVCLVVYDGDSGIRLPWPPDVVEMIAADRFPGWF